MHEHPEIVPETLVLKKSAGDSKNHENLPSIRVKSAFDLIITAGTAILALLYYYVRQYGLSP